MMAERTAIMDSLGDLQDAYMADSATNAATVRLLARHTLHFHMAHVTPVWLQVKHFSCHFCPPWGMCVRSRT